MKSNCIGILILLATSCIIACKSTKLKTKSNTKNLNKETRIITAGSGGGFTGRYTNYCIKPDSFIYNTGSDNDRLMEIGKLSSADFKKVYDLLDASNYEGIDYNKPGNITSYLDVQDGATHYKITWSKSSDFPPDKIVALHTLIFQLAKKYQK